MIAEALSCPDLYIPASQKGHSLTIAGVDDVLVQIVMGTRLERAYLTPSHEEPIPSASSLPYQGVCKARRFELYLITQMSMCCFFFFFFISSYMSPTSVHVYISFAVANGMVWYGMVWYGMVWYGMVWYGMVVWVWCGVVWCGMVWCGMVWCGVVWYGTIRYGTARHGTVRHGTVRYGMVWCLFIQHQCRAYILHNTSLR